MTRLAARITRASEALGLRCETEYVVGLSSGEALESVAYLQDLGAPNGMLILRSGEKALLHAAELSRMGYAFSVLEEPRSDEIFDLESVIGMFSDWGWSGSKSARPQWMR